MRPTMRTQFELRFVEAELALARPWLDRHCAWKLDACERVLSLQLRLLGAYLRAGMVQEQLGVGPPGNVVLRNALGNSISIGLASLRLLREGHYGSARVLARQLFEMMLTAKLAQLEPEVRERWAARREGAGPKAQVGISREILNRYWPRRPGDEPSPLHGLWARLNEFTHHTPFAQQPFLLPPPERIDARTGDFDAASPPTQEEQRAFHELGARTEFTTDLLFALLAMGTHLLAPHYRAATRSALRAYGEATGLGPEEARLRKELRAATREYLARLDADPRALGSPWRMVVRQFASDWRRAPGAPR